MNRVQKWWQRFRQWQHEPVHYKQLTDKKHVCLNCGLKFAGDYCPRCAQSAKVGRKIEWKAISRTILDAFNIENRSFFRTLWHLIWRPGYLISDYISGRRQMSYPPLKMLLVVAICLVFVENLRNWMGWEEVTEAVTSDMDISLEKIGTWADANPGWATLALNCLLILPTWHLFRYAPRHTQHTLPEGFFIQVFMASLILLISIIEFISDWLVWLLPIYYVITYCQLFGYGLWGTLWRFVVGLIEGCLTVVVIIFAIELVFATSYLTKELSTSTLIEAEATMASIAAVIAAIMHLINKISYKRRVKKQGEQTSV